MCIIKRYNGKVLTVNGFYALKCIGTHSIVSSNSFGHKPLGKNGWELGNFRTSHESRTGHKPIGFKYKLSNV